MDNKNESASPYDPQRWKQKRAAITPQYTFNATDLKAARRWQKQLRKQFLMRLGGFPETDSPLRAHTPLRPHTPLRARTLDRQEFDDYTRETVRFESRPGLPVFGYFLLPKGATEPLPAILCLHGHGYGVDPLVGLDGRGQPLHEPEYQNNFAIQAVRHGYAVLAIEILGFGRRCEPGVPPGDSSCQTLGGSALMLGESMAGWRVYDAMRSLDYLATRREVDANRLGAMGISGGGLNTLYLAACDERVRAAMVSGFLCTFRDSIMAIRHCLDNFVPGLLQDAEMSDIAGLIAPRALWCESGEEDSIFPVKAFRKALRDTRKIYDVFGAKERCDGEVFPGDHHFHGDGAWPFLEKHLKSPASD